MSHQLIQHDPTSNWPPWWCSKKKHKNCPASCVVLARGMHEVLIEYVLHDDSIVLYIYMYIIIYTYNYIYTYIHIILSCSYNIAGKKKKGQIPVEWCWIGVLSLGFNIYIYINSTHTYIRVNYNNSLTWIKATWEWFPLLTMISSEGEQWGRYNLPRYISRASPNHSTYIACSVESSSSASPGFRTA